MTIQQLHALIILAGGSGHGEEDGMTNALIWYALASMALLPAIVLLAVFFSSRRRSRGEDDHTDLTADSRHRS